MFKVDLSKTDFTSVETYENTVKEAEMELENSRKELEEYKAKGKERYLVKRCRRAYFCYYRYSY